MKKRSLHHRHLSTKETCSTRVAHTCIRSRKTTSSFSATNNRLLDRHKNLNTYSTDLSVPYHRNKLQKRSTIQNSVELSKTRKCSWTPTNENKGQKNQRNKISPEQERFSAEAISDRQYEHQRTAFHSHQLSSASSDRMGAVTDHHRVLNRKRKTRYSPLCKTTFVLIGALLIIAIGILIAMCIIKSKTTQNSLPTVTTNYTLRWSTTGDTVAGVVGQNGTAVNQLCYPFGLAIDFSNTLYIVDSNNNRVQRWLRGASTGATVCGQQNGTWGATSSDLRSPAGISVDSNSNIYVADGGNSRIQLWLAGATNGVTIAGNGSAGASSGQLNNAYGISLDSSSGTLYIADYTNHRVMSYASGASSGVMVAGSGISGTNTTQLSFPTSVYFDSPSNSMAIVNFATNNVVRWTLGASSWTLLGGSISGLYGNTSTLLTRPIGMTMDPMGNIYVADMQNNRIQLFLMGQSDAKTIAGVTGILGANSTLLDRPYSIALDNQLNLYVSDTYNHRVQRFLRY